MQRTRVQTLVLTAAVVAAVGWLVLRTLSGRGVELPPVSWLVVVVEVVIAAFVLVLGWSVRQYQRGKKPDLDPIRAARTAVLAKAACYTGAVLAGWYGSQVLVVLRDLDIVSQRARAVDAGIALLGAVAMAVAGLVAEWFCTLPPPEQGEGKNGERSRRPSPDPAAG